MDIGDTIRFMHVSHDRSSSYWLQGVLDKRVDKYEDAERSGWNRNRFRVNNIDVITHWGDLKPLPETLTINLTRKLAWSLGTDIELAEMKSNNLTIFRKEKFGIRV